MNDTIVALGTPNGQSAIAIVRLSGEKSIFIADQFFVGRKPIADKATHTIAFGKVMKDDQLLDEVVVTVYKNPHSFTGEDMIEISCHGSSYIIHEIIQLCLMHGARLAEAGEFTKRAFMHEKLDLSQAEAVADIIASENKNQHRLALQQMRGGYSEKIKAIRQELIDFAALIELELDFSEEDVEFADRTKFLQLIHSCLQVIREFMHSFDVGNVIKKGIPVAIIGHPNAGKSTLLNKLLNEEKAMVSEIAGTTRDFIEDAIRINGNTYRFIDTAGIRETNDMLESEGISRTFEKIKHAAIILYLADINQPYKQIVDDFQKFEFNDNQDVIILLNKSDKLASLCDAYDIEEAVSTLTGKQAFELSAKDGHNIEKILVALEAIINEKYKLNDLIVTNMRHLQAFKDANAHLEEVKKGLEHNLSGDLLSADIRASLNALGSVTGQITSEDVLSSIFSKFCIGK